MAIKTLNRLTIRTTGVAKQLANRTDRFGVGFEMAGPPADFLSQGQISLPRLSDRDQVVGFREDSGVSDMRYPASLGTPTGPVGSFSGATACRSVLAVLSATSANPSLRPAVSASGTTRDLWLPGDTASAADLESKLNPFRPSSDYQSPLRREVKQRDIPATKPESHSGRWPQATVAAATAAK